DPAADSQMIQPVFLRTQTGDNVAQALPVTQLRECHRQKLIPTGKTPYPIVASVTLHTPAKLVPGQVTDELRKQALSTVHVAAFLTTQQTGLPLSNSNRSQLGMDLNHYLAYACSSIPNS